VSPGTSGREEAKMKMNLVLIAGLALGLLPTTSRADTFRILGQELTGETTTTDADGSVRTVAQTGLDGFLYHVEGNTWAPAHAHVTMAITVNGDELRRAQVTYTQLGRGGFTVTIEIDPCWFEYVNERDATASEFGDDVAVRIEGQSPRGVLDARLKMWLTQRLALLGAKTAEPYVKSGVTLVPPRH
jgi:hypothetical protein